MTFKYFTIKTFNIKVFSNKVFNVQRIRITIAGLSQ
jgi:hypothetical protein